MLFVDGNGILHPRGVGLASHIGVCSDMPTVGVAKKLFHVDGIMRDEKHHEKVRQLNGKGDSFALLSTDGSVLGKAVLSGPGCSNPVYVSVGHRMGLDTAVKLVVACSKYRIPEPVRLTFALESTFEPLSAMVKQE
ncbi:endonuclease V-like isoform X2 [Corticium candelabrum]|uniref:endonuclease V-like isoform X2 n=1 Tax=Corticium candelabrum TaxID=121492 RepID=UPI002E37D401|nr:endonuclease V-like isoform X2 [Corticium candelabrum]